MQQFKHIGNLLPVLGVGALLVVAACVARPLSADDEALAREGEALLRNGRPAAAMELLRDLDQRSYREEVTFGEACAASDELELAEASLFRSRDAMQAAIRYRANIALSELAYRRRDYGMSKSRSRDAFKDAQSGRERSRSLGHTARAALALGHHADIEGLRARAQREGGLGDSSWAVVEAAWTGSTVAAGPTAPSPEAGSRTYSASHEPRMASDPSSVPARRTSNARGANPIPSAKPPSQAKGLHRPRIIPRASWNAKSIIRSRIEAMRAVRRITVHHTATSVPSGRSLQASFRLMRSIQGDHQVSRKWADIGYHYVIDSSGRVLEGRPLRYQGAHAGNRAANRHNLGISLEGNFQTSRPSPSQLRSLQQLTRWLCARYDIPGAKVQGHHDVLTEHSGGGTACPGKNLEVHLPGLRRLIARDRRRGTRARP